MNDKYIKPILFLLIVSFVISQSVYSLEVETHEAINEMIAKGSMNGFSLDSYLKNNLEISGGVNEFFGGADVFSQVIQYFLGYVHAYFSHLDILSVVFR